MLLLFVIRDLGSSLMFFGAFLALLYVATSRSRSSSSGWRCSGSARGSSARTCRHVHDRVDVWLRPVRRRRATPAAALPDRPLAVRPGRRRPARPGLRRGLLSCRRGGRVAAARRRRPTSSTRSSSTSSGWSAPSALLLVYLLFVQRGFKIALLARDSFSTLLAAGLTAVLRAAGLRDRRRRHEGDPADRRDAAVRLLRRLVDPGQLRPARAAAARLRPGAEAGDEHRRSCACSRLIVLLFAVLVVVTSRWTVARRRVAARQRAQRAPLLAQRRSTAGRSSRPTARCSRAAAPAREARLRAPLPARRRCSATRSATRTRLGQRRARALPQRRAAGQARRDRLARSTSCRASEQGDDVVTTLDPAAQRVAPEQLAATGSPGAVVALDPRTGAVLVMASVAGLRPERAAPTRRLQRAQQRRPARRCSTARRSRLRAGLDVQGRHRRGGDRLAASTRRTRSSTATRRRRSPACRCATTRTRASATSRSTTALTHSVNTVFAPDRRGARQADDGATTCSASASTASRRSTTRPTRCSPAARAATGGCCPPTSAAGRRRAHGDRPGQARGHAAADGDGRRGRRQRRQLMAPHLADRVVDPDGRTVDAIEPRVAATAMSPETAGAVNQMMRTVVEEGTGTAARCRASRSPARPARPRSDDRRGPHAAVVRRVRAGRRPADRDRGHRRALPGRLRRYRCRPDRHAAVLEEL